MSINWEKSADINNMSVDDLKMWFDKHPKSHKEVIAICDTPDCLKERNVRYQDYRDVCKSCSIKVDYMYDDLYNQPSHVLKRLFIYADGVLYNRFTTGRRSMGINKCDCSWKGYGYLDYNNKRYQISRIIFKMFNNYLPPEIDHIDHNTLNNKIENLRGATRTQNQWNSVNKGGSSNYKGVYHKDNGWAANITANGDRFFLGCFDTEKDAALAYNKKAIELHGDFACLNILTED